MYCNVCNIFINLMQILLFDIIIIKTIIIFQEKILKLVYIIITNVMPG